MRQRNIGWRLDHVFASEALAARATACPVLKDVGTSDHAPVIATFSYSHDDTARHGRQTTQIQKSAPLRAFVFRDFVAAFTPMSIVVQKYGGSSVADVTQACGRSRSVSCGRVAPDTMSSWSCRRWATRRTSCWRSPSRCPPTPSAASSTCCSPPASASRWRCCRSPSASWAAMRSASPAASPASSPTIGTSTPASSRSGRFACRTNSRAAASSSIAGYQGVSYRREVTTLGRGGSDTTAVAMAAALGAEYCEICSDVDGVYTADPRVVPAARRIGTLSYEETQELAESGAKVLNAQAVEFAKDERHRDLRARATAVRCPAATRRPTARSSRRARAARAGHGGRRRQRTRHPRAVLDGVALARTARVPRRDTRSAGSSCTSARPASPRAVAGKPSPGRAACARTMQARFGNRVRLVDTHGAVSVVGAGINASFENVRRGTAALAATGSPVDGVATSSFRITWLIDRARLDDAVRLLH